MCLAPERAAIGVCIGNRTNRCRDANHRHRRSSRNDCSREASTPCSAQMAPALDMLPLEHATREGEDSSQGGKTMDGLAKLRRRSRAEEHQTPDGLHLGHDGHGSPSDSLARLGNASETSAKLRSERLRGEKEAGERLGRNFKSFCCSGSFRLVPWICSTKGTSPVFPAGGVDKTCCEFERKCAECPSRGGIPSGLDLVSGKCCAHCALCACGLSRV